MTGATGKAFLKPFCCSYGSKFTKTATGFDCAKIPSPSKTNGDSLAGGANGFCGGELGNTDDSIDTKTVCCKLSSGLL